MYWKAFKRTHFWCGLRFNNGIGAMKEPEDHRTRVAAKPRSEAQERLFSVLIVVSEKPAKEISIKEVYTHAETF
jgi:hypothetical protein